MDPFVSFVLFVVNWCLKSPEGRQFKLKLEQDYSISLASST